MNREDMFKKEIAELQKSNRQLMIRIKELHEHIHELRKKLEKK